MQANTLNEAINAGISRALSDGVPGLSRRTVVGTTLGDLSASDTYDVGASDTFFVETNSGLGEDFTTLQVYPGDIITFGNGSQRLVDYVDPTVKHKVHFGAPLGVALTGTTVTINRRGIRIPTTGSVFRVSDPDNSKSARIPSSGSHILPDPDAAAFNPLETCSDLSGVISFVQGYDARSSETSYVGLYPCPTAATEALIIQSDFYEQLDDDTDSAFFPEPALDAIMERARYAYLTWTGEKDPTRASLAKDAVQDTADELQTTGNSPAIFRR
jgi:hypothetical protein